MRTRSSAFVSLLTLSVGVLHCANGDQLGGGGPGTGGSVGDAAAGGGAGGSLPTGGASFGGSDPGTGGSAPGTGGMSPGTGGAVTGGAASGGDSGAGGDAGAGGGGAGSGDAGDAGAWDASADDGSVDDGSAEGGWAGGGGLGGSGGSSTGGEGGTVSTGGVTGTGGTVSTGGAAGTGGSGGGATGGAGGTETGGAGGAGGTGAGGTGGSGEGGSSGGDAGSGGQGGGGGSGGDPDAGAPEYVNLAPPMLSPLDPTGGTVLDPPPPAGWTWYPIEGAQCRDGSQAGLYVHFTASDKLYIYFEGGGACTNEGFCNFNPPNVDSAILGTGETVLGSAFGVGAVRQQPGVYEGGVLRGIFDTANAQNQFQDWNGVYIPYCTGDVHFGTKPNGTVPGVAAPQQFVGYLNTRRFIGHLVPTFKDTVHRVIVTGASAGSFAAGLNFSMIQDAFGDIPVDAILDSGLPFTDAHMPPCMQQRWREIWGLNDALPPDCAECFNADGGGLLNLADFLIQKHPNAMLAAVSSVHDEVMRLFFSMGLQDCANIDTADPVAITLGQIFPDVYYPAAAYEAGLLEVKARYLSTGRLGTYVLGGFNAALHQHTFRARFYDPFAGTMTIAQFVQDFLGGTMQHIGP
jgi:hypothetical protein